MSQRWEDLKHEVAKAFLVAGQDAGAVCEHDDASLKLRARLPGEGNAYHVFQVVPPDLDGDLAHLAARFVQSYHDRV